MICIFLLLNFLSSWIFKKVIMGQSVANVTHSQWLKSNRTQDYLILGDSHAKSAFDPTVLGNAFNFAMPMENYLHTFYKLKYILSQGADIDCVILNTDPHSFTSRRSDRTPLSDYYVQFVDYLEIGRRKSQYLRYLKTYISATFFPYVGKTAEVIEFTTKKRSSIQKGFKIRTTLFTNLDAKMRRKQARIRASHHIRNTEVWDKYQVLYFRKIIDLCLENGIGIVLVQTPLSKEYLTALQKITDPREVPEKVRGLIKENPKIIFCDFRDAFLNHPELFSNSDHLNFRGARKLTIMLKMHLDRLQDIPK